MGCGSLGTVGDHTKTLEMSDEDKEEEEVMMSAGWFQSPPISWGIISLNLPAAPFFASTKARPGPKEARLMRHTTTEGDMETKNLILIKDES